MKKIIFVPTWRCQLKCAYCDYATRPIYADEQTKTPGYIAKIFDREETIDRELSADEWLKYLEPFRPYLLEMTGGEPTLYKEFPDLIQRLPSDCRWAITSNTLNTETIRNIDLTKNLQWTASYHYHSDVKFANLCNELRDAGVNVRITLVATPDNYETLIEKIEFFKALYFDINIHPILKKSPVWIGHNDIWDKVQAIEGVNVVKDIPPAWTEKSFSRCKAGSEYFALMPDGKAMRCMSKILSGETLGHIKDLAPAPEIENKKCNGKCVFPCDLQIAEARY